MADASAMSDEELHALLSGGKGAEPDSSTMSDTELHGVLSGKGPASAPQAAPSKARPSTAASPPVIVVDPVQTNNPDMPPGAAQPVDLTPEQRAAAGAGLAGVVRGARDLIDPATRLLASPFGQGEAVAEGNKNDLSSYESAYGNNPLASAGRMAGEGLALVPAMATVNPVVAGAGRLLTAGVSRIAPMAGNVLRWTGDLLGGSAGGPTGVAPRLLQAGSRAAQGGVLGAEAAGMTSGKSDEPFSQQVASGAATGAVLGPTIPAAIEAGGGAYRALTGASAAAGVPQAVAELAQMARDKYGIMLKAPQIGLNPTLRYAGNALKLVPGSGAGAEVGETQAQFNRAVTRTFGEDAPSVTPDVLSQAQKRIGGVMNGVESAAHVSLDNTFINDISTIEANARSSLPDSEFGVVRRQLDNILKNLQPGDTITGTTYGNLIHKGSPLDAALSSNDANIRNYAGQIREALRDSLTRSISPADAAAYQQARTQYKNLKTVEPLTLRADTTGGAAPSTGDVSPAALRAAVNRSFGANVAQAGPGDVPLNDLARIGQLMKEPPTSGTAERGGMLAFGAKAAELGGALAAGHYAGIMPAAAALGAGMAGGRMASSYLRSNFLAQRMIDAALRPPAAGNPLMAQLQPYIGPAGVLTAPAGQQGGAPR